MGNGSVNSDDVQVASPAPAGSVLPGSKYMSKEGSTPLGFFLLIIYFPGKEQRWEKRRQLLVRSAAVV